MPKVKLPRRLRDLANRANGGCGEAALAIADHYRDGTGGVEKNDELARQWVEKGAELGDADAQCIFGVANEKAGELRVAYEWYEKAAAQGHAAAEFNLARCYNLGRGVELNRSKAAELFLKSALQGNASAQHDHAFILSSEMHEFEEAVKWFEKSAAQGNAASMYNIGILYLNGYGVQRSSSKAREWFAKASSNGDKDADEILMEHFPDFFGDMQDAKKRDYVETEKGVVENAAHDRDLKAALHSLRSLKIENLAGVVEFSGVKLSAKAVKLYISGPLPDHKACSHIHHLGLCFLHGRCGLERNLRMAKDTFKLSQIYDGKIFAVDKELEKLRACVTCGKPDARWGCKLCRGVRYCDKRCQQRDWNRGDPPHKQTCSRVVNGIFPPGKFDELRESKNAKKRGA